MCMISIPHHSNSDHGAPLQRAIDSTAVETGLDVVTVALTMSYLLEGIADEVSRGRSVRVPGFGMFSPVVMSERHRRMSRDPTPRCKPMFSASRTFRQQVAVSAPPSEVETKRFKKHQKNHNDHHDGDCARVFTAMESMRQQILAQLAGARGERDRGGRPRSR